ncbi:hypothetical protein FA13DRAFT_1822811 [Coprinellus micaceus]|uniref:Uncharacterized protein n=1 Tax=Coprinellus micaceus TaxID=71717 RepID=A0A4Y7S3J5_COPMI|nr:hypothetical protein FA13DRAFT_1822811 [Coprinellus micaceus]
MPGHCYEKRAERGGTYDHLFKAINSLAWKKTSFHHGDKYLAYKRDFTSIYSAPRGRSGLAKREFIMMEDNTPLNILLTGQVVSNHAGSQLTSSGHYYINPYKETKPIRDGVTVRPAILLEAPWLAGMKHHHTFANQVAMLKQIFKQDMEDCANPEEAEKFWSPSIPRDLKNNNNDPYIKIFFPSMYKVPRMTAEGSKVTDEEIKMFDLEDDDTADQRSDTATESSHTASETDDEPQGPVVQRGALYDPNLLPDFGGPLFQLEKAKLVQQEVYDVDDNLVALWDMYDKLRPGTLVLVNAKLFVWYTSTSEDRRAYQIVAEKVKVIDESDEPIEERDIPRVNVASQTLPSTPSSSQRTPARRSDADNAFDLFESPSKKSRRG